MFRTYTRNDANALFIAGLPLLMGIAGFFLADAVVSAMGFAALPLAYADAMTLKKAGHPAPPFWWGIISPVYLWKRDRWQHKPVRLFQLWIAALVLSLAGSYLQAAHDDSNNLADSACLVVTKIMQEDHLSPTCISVTDMKEMVSNRFWNARALMSTGKKMPITIELKGNDQIYVTVPDTDKAF
ncbi:hypothetical protein [Atlantibacter hermannii]|uniref:hypothetical protein n=1 Tax=Atlantibacter hermannii TaxID=565 RepID=UPI00289E1049|nr:hypothetical protein [Atlantibacter hermannii]